MTCARCGCTDEAGCVLEADELGAVVVCEWFRPRLCSACVTPADLELEETDRELDAYEDLADELDVATAAHELIRRPGRGPAAPILFDAYGVPIR